MLQYWPSQNYFANKCLKIQYAIYIINEGHNKMVNVNNKDFLVILKMLRQDITNITKDTNKFFVP